MYATIRRYELLPSDVPELRLRARERFLPLIMQIPGFISYDLIEAEHGVVMSVSVFLDEAAAAAESQRAAAEESQRAAAAANSDVADPIRQARQITTGEITVHQTT